MEINETKELFEKIYSEFRKDYERHGDQNYLYKEVDRDQLYAISDAYFEGHITAEQMYELGAYVLARFVKENGAILCPSKEHSDVKDRFQGMSQWDLRVYLEDYFAHIIEIESERKEEYMDEETKKVWEWVYKTSLLGIAITASELFNREKLNFNSFILNREWGDL